MRKLTLAMLEMIFSPERNILPYGHSKCYDSVNAWCDRILKRDPSVKLKKSEWLLNGERLHADSLLTDAIWCQLWFAGHAKTDALLANPKQAFEMLKQACFMYDQILVQFVPQKLVNDYLYAFASPLTCALQYLECREKMLSIVEKQKAHADLGAKSSLSGTRACLQMLCSKFAHAYSEKEAIQTSAHALYYKGASLKAQGNYAAAYPFFIEAGKRYSLCDDVKSERALQQASTCNIASNESNFLDRETMASLFQINLIKL